ncbi:MAG: enoyl-[acyl-carrier-protein] reductase FabV [bacterium]|nr:enoyl-[acyl-carrier-protein] reductase FabV [Deltaproteobacteria bacterium]MCP4905335.1 enoyl-[acyl-carrier-protein] reductase FabV [bacterium]
MSVLSLATPRARGLMILTAHPEGCRVLTQRQIERARAAFPAPLAAAEGKTALILGSTTFGYGSSIAISLKEAGFTKIIGVGYETPPAFRDQKVAIAPAGWYLTEALHRTYPEQRTYFGDAFSDETRDRVIDDLHAAGERIDLLVYSVAAPRRTHLEETWTSALKVVGEPLDVVGLDFKSGEHKEVHLEPASEIEIEHTRRVMGGDDLALWANALLYADRAHPGFKIASLSYIGPDFEPLRRIYWDGALGAAKKHIDATTRSLDARLQKRLGGSAFTCMNPAVVTGASVAIPAMLKYIADYLAVVDSGIGAYDDPLAVGIGFAHALYGAGEKGQGEAWREMLDEEGRLRLDANELVPETQTPLRELWETAQPGAVAPLTARGLELFKKEFMQLYGWEVDGVDYEAATDFAPPLGEKEGVVHLIE